MQATHITEKILNQLNACDNSVQFVKSNKLLPFPISKLHLIKDEQFNNWIYKNITNASLELNNNKSGYLYRYINSNTYTKFNDNGDVEIKYDYITNTQDVYVYKYNKLVRIYHEYFNYDIVIVDNIETKSSFTIKNNKKVTDRVKGTKQNNIILKQEKTRTQLYGSDYTYNKISIIHDKCNGQTIVMFDDVYNYVEIDTPDIELSIDNYHIFIDKAKEVMDQSHTIISYLYYKEINENNIYEISIDNLEKLVISSTNKNSFICEYNNGTTDLKYVDKFNNTLYITFINNKPTEIHISYKHNTKDVYLDYNSNGLLENIKVLVNNIEISNRTIKFEYYDNRQIKSYMNNTYPKI